MTDPPTPPPPSPLEQGTEPEARIKKHWTSYWIWLIPLAALGMVGYLGYRFAAERGPLISITFESADGLNPQQTEVKYKAVTIGRVEEVHLSEDRSHVVAEVRMDPGTENMLTKDARFWVVRPRLGGGLQAFQSGLKTLVSGAYVTLDPGEPKPDAEMKTYFQGLSVPPSIRSNQPGTVYVLEAVELGNIKSGSLIQYRGTDVGEVLSHRLDPDGEGATIRIFVESPYDEKVVDETCFWNASGINIGSSSEGLSIEIQSARMLFRGGIAFDTPDDALQDEPAKPETKFRLYETESQARVEFYEGSKYVSYFHSSVRGLSLGSEVHMYGQRVGAVTDIALARDPRADHEGKFAVRVEYVIQPARALPKEEQSALLHGDIQSLVNRDLRVVLHGTNLLTGQKALALKYVATGEEPPPLEEEGQALVLPADAEDFSDITTSLASIANDIDRIPFGEIGHNLNRTLKTVSGPELKGALASLKSTLDEAHELVKEARSGIGPALAALPKMSRKLESAADQAQAALGANGYGPGSSIHRQLERMVENVAEAARSVRLLADHLDRQPESLIRGRSEDTP